MTRWRKNRRKRGRLEEKEEGRLKEDKEKKQDKIKEKYKIKIKIKIKNILNNFLFTTYEIVKWQKSLFFRESFKQKI